MHTFAKTLASFQQTTSVRWSLATERPLFCSTTVFVLGLNNVKSVALRILENEVTRCGEVNDTTEVEGMVPFWDCSSPCATSGNHSTP